MKRFIACLLGVLLTFSVVIPAANAGWEEAMTVAASDDDATAFMEWKILADQGNVEAQVNLGLMYDNGRGVDQDYKQAVKWYQLAADQGNALAQNNLGLMYDSGRGVAQDYKMAHMYYNIGAANGSDSGRKNRDEIAKIMTPQQIAEAQQMAREWMAKH